ncbi:MAG: DNA polymerase IV, partial [Ruminococcaceae bacterium]|nr:DNA polymerase IV [Oscillospiraceae bacterium]
MERVIFLVDMNAFYIACETTRNPQLAGRPAAVAGDPQKRAGIILAANYEARAVGVKTTMTLYEACGLCPGLKLVPPDHAFYEEKSKEVMLYLSGYTPLLEQNSIDEAYLDLTGCEALNGPPLQAARSIQKGINRQFGLWCSIGIAPNKFLAKMASELKKPMGITCLEHPDVPARLWPLPIRSLYG